MNAHHRIHGEHNRAAGTHHSHQLTDDEDCAQQQARLAGFSKTPKDTDHYILKNDPNAGEGL